MWFLCTFVRALAQFGLNCHSGPAAPFGGPVLQFDAGRYKLSKHINPRGVRDMPTTCPIVKQGPWRIPALSTVQKLYESLRVEVRKPGAWERDSLVLTAYLAYTGARISEALQAATEDLFYDKSLIRIKGIKHSGFRTVPVPLEIMYLLQRYVVFRGRGDLLFPISRNAAAQQVYRETKRLVDCSLSPHLLRHAYAIKLLAIDGWAPDEVRQALGHRRIRTTEVYVTYVGYSPPRRGVSL